VRTHSIGCMFLGPLGPRPESPEERAERERVVDRLVEAASRALDEKEQHMSWSVQAVGKRSAVRAAIAKQFSEGTKCSEPEETIRLAAAGVIDSALAGQDDSHAVMVAASGSMGYKNYAEQAGVYNSLAINVEVLHGFAE
jgi:hypothetical protein